MSENDPIPVQDEKPFDWRRYFARSFLLPLIGMGMLFALAWGKSYPVYPDLVLLGVGFALFAGVFSLSELVNVGKLWVGKGKE